MTLKPVAVNSLTPLFTAPQILRDALQPPSNISTVPHPGTEHLCFVHRLENAVLI